MLSIGKSFNHNGQRNLIRLVTPASIFALALSIFTLPLTVKAFGNSMEVYGTITVDQGSL